MIRTAKNTMPMLMLGTAKAQHSPASAYKPSRISSEVVVVDVVVEEVRVDVAVMVIDVVVVVVNVVVVVADVVVVVVDVVVVVVDVVEVGISSSPERQVVTISSSLTSPPPVLTSQPLQSDRGHRTYLSCSLTRRPL